MRIVWITLNFVGFGLIAGGAIAHYYGHNTSVIVFSGMACMAASFAARRAAFRRK